jgi:hypothetical protein
VRKTALALLCAGLILRTLVDDLAVIHVQLARMHGLSARHGVHMEVLNPMQVGQYKGEAFALFRRDKVIDINCMNRLVTGLIATTVAKRLPASGETREKDISHDNLPSC